LASNESSVERQGAVDAIKGVAIVFVLMLHSYGAHIPYSLFWVRQAVPLLVVMMGYTGVLTHVRPIGQYLRRRAVRLLVPWSVAWLVALIIMLVKGNLRWRSDVLWGALPTPGPGNYFITIAFAFVLALPLLRWLLDKGPWVLLTTCFVVDLTFQLAAGHFPLDPYLFKASLLRYLFAVGVGMVLASGRMLWPLVPISFAYLVALTMGFKMPFIRPAWQSHFLLAAGYTAAFVRTGLRFSYPRFLRSFGTASWHIFLVQIVWFGQVAHFVLDRLGLQPIPSALVSIGGCLVVGLVFANIDQAATGAVRRVLESRRRVVAP
jgi:hypothetical protein